MAHGVREIDLHNLFGDIIVFPRNVFTCQRLEVLRLRGDFLIDIPDSNCLPILKIRVLHLILVRYATLTTFENLISICPILQELVIERESYDFLDKMVINSLSLKSLRLHVNDMWGFHEEFGITVDAQNLEYLNLSHYIVGANHISDLPSLVKANIDAVQNSGN